MRDRFWALAIGGMLTSVLLAGDVSDPVQIMWRWQIAVHERQGDAPVLASGRFGIL